MDLFATRRFRALRPMRPLRGTPGRMLLFPARPGPAWRTSRSY